MDKVLEDFLGKHRTASRWLDDIISVIIGYSGQAHVKTIARELSKSYLRDINTIENTITRRLNDFCSDAADFEKSPAYDLFQKVAPATFRLRTYPDKPDILELIQIEFDEVALESMWKMYKELARKKFAKNWSSLKNEQKLMSFAKWISKDKYQEEYVARQKISRPSDPF